MYKKVINPFTNQDSTEQIKRISDGAAIPFDNANTDYQEYLKWYAKGNRALPADEVTE